ncbi:MAG: TonB family protein [Betaproteobacteria bacterium]|nr:TonB family protein [Betaproteobacteria bacterium]
MFFPRAMPGAFRLALLLSFILHTLLLAVRFSLPDIRAQSFMSPQLELVLVNSKSVTPPEKADALAQSNLDGGGNTDEDRRAKSPLPAMSQDQRQQDIEAAQRQVARLEEENRQLMTQIRAAVQLPDKPSTTEQNRAPLADHSGDGQGKASSLEMSELEAQISQQYDAYQKRPRKLFIGARTQEYAFARYVEDWRIKVERIGNENYPAASRDNKIYGKLQLTVSIRADGTLDSIEVTRSSGSAVLDNAAIAIVNRAAPFSPFPEDIRKKADIVSITRTWTFAPSDQLSTHD